MSIDLHVHTKASDGLYSPADIVKMAVSAGVSVLGIADHDTVNGIDEARAAASKKELELIPGVEINSYNGDAEYHILGYFLDHKNSELLRALEELRAARIRRMHRIVSKLGLIGITVNPQEILGFAESGTVGRPHIAQALVRNGYATSIRDAFDRYIGAGKPAYAPRSKLTPVEAIDIIKTAGGLAALAHPGLWHGDALIPQLAAWGIIGIEVYSPDHTAVQVARYRDIARGLGLVALGGSDFHGWGDPARNKIGMASTPPEEFARLRDMSRKQRCHCS
ncbi:MAG: PHP domain-containing protein [Candidatus Aureabacteria bacterium]|nr:PHP domain-containing protein [Candidatus Auribacterota bacterium]